MKSTFVKTSNWTLFSNAVMAMENRGSEEACVLLLSGDPGSGKTCAVDRFGSDKNAVYLQGMPGMSVSFLTDYLADRLGVEETRNYQKFNAILNKMRESKSPIILDEAQHAAEGRAKPLEYLRRVAEQAGVMLVLVCHTSERSRFTESKMAHINTRISAAPMFKPASEADCALYINELCEVAVDIEIAKVVMQQSRGRYRLINNAIKSLEALAARLSKTALTLADVKNIRLCEDVARVL